MTLLNSNQNTNLTNTTIFLLCRITTVLPSSITFAIISTMFFSPKSIFLYKNTFSAILSTQSCTNHDPVHLQGKHELILFIHKGACTAVVLICLVQRTPDSSTYCILYEHMTEQRRVAHCARMGRQGGLIGQSCLSLFYSHFIILRMCGFDLKQK